MDGSGNRYRKIDLTVFGPTGGAAAVGDRLLVSPTATQDSVISSISGAIFGNLEGKQGSPGKQVGFFRTLRYERIAFTALGPRSERVTLELAKQAQSTI